MKTKTLIWGGMFVGSSIGGFLPTLWGNPFSFWSVILTAVGGFFGIWLGLKLSQKFGI